MLHVETGPSRDDFGKVPEVIFQETPTLGQVVEEKIPEEVLRKEGEDNVFQRGNLISLDLFVRDMRKLPLLTAEQEKKLGAEIFAAKLALRSLKTIFEILSPQDRYRAENFFEGKGKLLLDTLKKELLAKQEAIEKKGNGDEDNSSDKAFLEDVLNNDESIQGKLKELSPVEEDEVRKQAISVLANQLFAFINKGNEAFDQLTSSNLRLVLSIAKKYQKHGLSIEDLNGYGQEGLLMSVAKFDFRRNLKFSSFAVWWIKQKITRAVMDHGSAIRIPVHINEEIGKLRRKQRTLNEQGNGDIPEEIFNNGIVSAIKVRGILSLNAPIGRDGENSAEFGDFVQDPTDVGEVVSRNLLIHEIKRQMSILLDKRQSRVLSYRFGLDGRERTLIEIANEFGVTPERIRQIEAKALYRLRRSKEFAEMFTP